MVRTYPTLTLCYRPLTQDLIAENLFRGELGCADEVVQGADIRVCVKGTHETVLRDINAWAKDFNKPPIYLLEGLAGTGKSTIARTIVENMKEAGQFCPSFFCSRDSEDRNTFQSILRILAVQFASKSPRFMLELFSQLQLNGGLAFYTGGSMMRTLLHGPLAKSNIPNTVIVIDALDECKDIDEKFLPTLVGLASEIGNLKFFITSRSGLSVFRAQDKNITRSALLGDEADKDIRLFFTHEFSKLRKEKGLLDSEDLDYLCQRAGGLFAYAAAMMNTFIDGVTDIKSQLASLRDKPENEFLNRDIGGRTLGSFYMTALEEDFRNVYIDDDIQEIHLVYGAVLFAKNPISPFTIETLLDSDVLLYFTAPILILKDYDHPVEPLHRSLLTFFTDPKLCTNKKFRISPATVHKDLLIKCLELMNKKLEGRKSEPTDPGVTGPQPIDPALKYACVSWYKHLADVIPAENAPEIVNRLKLFLLLDRMPLWEEVVRVHGTAEDTEDGRKILENYLTEVSLVPSPSNIRPVSRAHRNKVNSPESSRLLEKLRGEQPR